MYCEKISSRFWEIYHLIECRINLWPDFALSTVFFYLCFYERKADKPARPIEWLGLCERKYCLLRREKVSWQHYEPFWRNITSKIVMAWKLLPKFRHITWFFLSMFLWKPGWQTSAANWLTRFMWKEILSPWRRESIMKTFRAVLEKCNIKDSLLMHVPVYILLWTSVCCYRCFHERQSYKLARPIGWLGSNERK